MSYLTSSLYYSEQKSLFSHITKEKTDRQISYLVTRISDEDIVKLKNMVNFKIYSIHIGQKSSGGSIIFQMTWCRKNKR